MTRTDELTARLLDGTLADAEWAELEALLAADPAAEATFFALLDLEAVLRGERTDLDLSEATVARVKNAQAEKTTRAVMAGIVTNPPPAWAARPGAAPPPNRRWLFTTGGFLAVAAGLLVGLWLGTGTPGPSRPDTGPAFPPVADITHARLTRALGSVELLTPQGEVVPATEGRDVPPGHTLRTVGEDSLARVELPDRTTLDIEPDSVVRFLVGDPHTRPRLFLAAGQLTAAVPDLTADRPLVVGTGVAEVLGRKGGTFVVASAGPESARVDIKRGNVDVVRADAPKPVAVAGGAFFHAGLARVFTDPGLRINRTPARALTTPGPRDAAFTPDGDVLVASARQLTLWTKAGGTADTPLTPRKANDGFAAFTPDATAVVTFTTAKDDRVVVRGLPGGEERAVLNVRMPEPRLWTVAPAAAWLALADPRPNNKRVRVLDGATGAERFARDFDELVTGVAASHGGKVLAVGLTDQARGPQSKVVLLDAATGDRLSALPTQRKGVAALAFSPDGRYLAAGFNGLIQVWDVQARELVRSISGFERVITALAFDPGGKALAAATPDGLVWVWSVATGRPTQLIELGSRGVRSIRFSPDGQRLATVPNAGPVALWDVAPVAEAAAGDVQ